MTEDNESGPVASYPRRPKRKSMIDEMVELAAEAIFNTPVPPEHPVDWDCMPPEIADIVRAKARAALGAVLPPLLARVEAAERELAEVESDRDRNAEAHTKACVTIAEMYEAATGRGEFGPVAGVIEDVRRVRAERDALTAVVERLKEQVAFIERERDDAQMHAEGVAEGARIQIDILGTEVRAALAIHKYDWWSQGRCVSCDGSWPCATARALGVTS